MVTGAFHADLGAREPSVGAHMGLSDAVWVMKPAERSEVLAMALERLEWFA